MIKRRNRDALGAAVSLSYAVSETYYFTTFIT